MRASLDDLMVEEKEILKGRNGSRDFEVIGFLGCESLFQALLHRLILSLSLPFSLSLIFTNFHKE